MGENEIGPALSSEEWERAAQLRMARFGTHMESAERHLYAALLLHDQPFGFTHVDLVMLRLLAANARKQEANSYWAGQARDLIAERLESLAQRISALLPPHP